MYANEPRCKYNNSQLAEVICQLRFPQILSIDANPPAAFQDEIRGEFPIYAANKEASPPKLTGGPGNLKLENAPTTFNYQFATPDNSWRINLTSKFISLSCSSYTTWEDFAARLDTPLAAFIKIYKPAFFERIGLRYMNFFSKKALNLEDAQYSEMFQPAYLGLLFDDDVDERSANRCSVDAEIAVRNGCNAKIHAGPGIVKRNGQTDGEVRFIFDQDLFMSGNIPVNYSAGALQTLHAQAYPIFRGAITDLTHNAMDPEPI